MAKYILMNKNTEVMVLEQDDNTYKFTEVFEFKNIAYAPLVVGNTITTFPEKTLNRIN